MKMTVVNKKNNKAYEVFDITYDKVGYPHFLIYKDEQWVRMSAKHFRPYTLNDTLKEFGGLFGQINSNTTNKCNSNVT